MFYPMRDAAWPPTWCKLERMNDDTEIQLSGPFSAPDASGKIQAFKAIRIFDEGYGIIDVHVDLAAPVNSASPHTDQVLVGHILARLRSLGYVGPDFGPGDPGLQDSNLIVLEAPEQFNEFAARKGWKNLAEEFADPPAESAPQVTSGPVSSQLLDGLMRRFKGH